MAWVSGHKLEQIATLVAALTQQLKLRGLSLQQTLPLVHSGTASPVVACEPEHYPLSAAFYCPVRLLELVL